VFSRLGEEQKVPDYLHCDSSPKPQTPGDRQPPVPITILLGLLSTAQPLSAEQEFALLSSRLRGRATRTADGGESQRRRHKAGGSDPARGSPLGRCGMAPKDAERGEALAPRPASGVCQSPGKSLCEETVAKGIASRECPVVPSLQPSAARG